MEQMKIYTVVKVEVKDGCDAINLLITTTDKGKVQKRFKREVTLDKKQIHIDRMKTGNYLMIQMMNIIVYMI